MVGIELVPYQAVWPEQFEKLGSRLRAALGLGPMIHHIGSTSIPGIAAKPIIDVQVGVTDFEPFDVLRSAVESAGYRYWGTTDDRRKRYFVFDEGERRVSNLHVRRWAEFSPQAALIFRDFLRADAAARQRYEDTKRTLAARHWDRTDDYAAAKGDVIWSLLREAAMWSWGAEWRPGPSDA